MELHSVQDARHHRYEKIVTWGPLLVSLVFILTMASARFRPFLSPFLHENGPLELATFVAFLCAAYFGIRLAIASRRIAPWWHTTFLGLFALGLLLVALEEIAWGQNFFGFASPEFFGTYNKQGETTLHNLGSAHGKSHYLYMLFCLGGLCGAYLPKKILGDLSVPRIMVPTLWIIFILTGLEFIIINFELGWAQRGIGRKAPELIEFWVAWVSFLYCGKMRLKLQGHKASHKASYKAS